MRNFDIAYICLSSAKPTKVYVNSVRISFCLKGGGCPEAGNPRRYVVLAFVRTVSLRLGTLTSQREVHWAKPLVAVRRRRNSPTRRRSARGELKNSPVDCFLRGDALQERASPLLYNTFLKSTHILYGIFSFQD